MTAHEIDNRAELTHSAEQSKFTAMLPELLQGASTKQDRRVEFAATEAKTGLPQLELVGDHRGAMKEDHPQKFSSKYETGSELKSDRELKQVGLNPKDVKHTTQKESGDWTEEKSSVKYPNGLEVTVTGRTKHMASGRDVTEDPQASIKEPLPKGFHQDKDGGITDDHNRKVAQINKDGTITVKVRDQYVTQSPAGVVEETVIEHKDGSGMLGRLKLND